MKLNRREKLLLIGAIIILAPFMLYRFALAPIHEFQVKQFSRIMALVTKDSQLQLFGQELQYLKRTDQTRTASLSRRIDGLLRQIDVKTRSRTVVEASPTGVGQRLVLKLDQLNLTELVNLVYKIENAKPVIVIENIDINRSYQSEKSFRISAALSSQ